MSIATLTQEVLGLQSNVSAAMDNLSQGIERLAVETVKILAKMHPTSDVIFISAMGTWSFEIDNVEEEPDTVFDLFMNIDSDYHGIMPTVYVKAKGGKIVEILHQW